MGREYDVHGNQGGGFVGPNPYPVALSDFVDTVWFETSGMSAYDIFKYGWNNAWGAFRFEIGLAMTRGKKPFMSMTGFRKRTPDIVEHELAEECAGGGVLFVNQAGFEKEPELEQKLTEYFRFRHDHRALFVDEGRRRGWYDSCARTTAVDVGDQLVELGVFERAPDGYGRRQFYRRKQ